MKNGYKPPNFTWTGRIDGNTHGTTRWHQVVRPVNLSDTPNISGGFCLIGFKSDLGVIRNKGRPGASQAPDVIRKYLSSLPWHYEGENLYDAGDVVCTDDLEESQEILAQCVSSILSHGSFPIIIGGGHEVAYASVTGDMKHLGEMPSVINFDAHFDIRPYSEGANSGTSFRQLADMCRKSGTEFHYLCIGIQKSGNTRQLFEDAKDYEMEYISYEETNDPTKSDSKIKSFLDLSEVVHLTICTDVFSQSIAPGVSAPQPFGITAESFLHMFQIILSSKKIISFDIAEVSPPLDLDDRTSRLAAHIIFRVVDCITSNQNHVKEGL